MKVTRSAGAALATSGLFGCKTAETEDTFASAPPDDSEPEVAFGAAAFPDVAAVPEAPGVAVESPPQLANAAPTHSAATTAADARSTEQS
jgi:hypothetical protein